MTHLLFALLFVSFSACASGLDALKLFLTGSKTLKADFEQVVTDKGGKQVQKSQGTMQFARPGKFRWEYAKPYQQLVVGDGEKLWLYDPDLKQVTVRKLDRAIGSSPAALLAGDVEIEKSFNLKDGGQSAGMEWVEATPKSSESSFERVRMGFADGRLKVLELADNFGQTSVIRLSQVQVNDAIPPERFTFTPPKGADVIGE